jgi:hypothetical protein
MSLHYDIRNCNPPSIQDVNDSCNHYVLCMLAMNFGIPEITEKNVDEVFARIQALEADGGYRLANGVNIKFTLEEVRRWIGLKTNVTSISSRKFWHKFKRV